MFKSLADSQNMMTILGLLNCFGGGALLAVAVAHVFPEAIDPYPATDSDDYPAAAMLCARSGILGSSLRQEAVQSGNPRDVATWPVLAGHRSQLPHSM